MKLKDFMMESKQATDKEYYASLWKFFKRYFTNDQEFKDFKRMVQSNDEVFSHYGRNFLEKSDNGNFFVKWTETNNKEIMLHGISTKSGHLSREDIPDFNKWVDRLYDKMKEGWALMTSPHSISKLLLNQVRKKAEKDGKKLDMEDMGMSFSFGDNPFLKFDTYRITLK